MPLTLSKALWVGTPKLQWPTAVIFIDIAVVVIVVCFVLANAGKVYPNAVAKTQKIWPAYLESIMKVMLSFLTFFFFVLLNHFSYEKCMF